MIEINLTIIIQVIQFLILIYILNQILFKPISQVLAERDQKITTWEVKTRELQETARLNLERYERQLDKEKLQARENQEQLTKELKQQEEENLRAVSEQAVELVASTRQTLEAERERLRSELRQQATDLSHIMAEKVLGRKLS